MTHTNYKQIFTFALCTLIAPHALYAYTQTINGIELKVSDCAAKPQELLISITNPVTSTVNPITVDQFLQKSMHPVRLKISNNSKNSIVISPKSVLKEYIDADQAARMFHIDHLITPHLIAEACVVGILCPIQILSGIAYWYGVNHYIKTTNEHLTQAFNQTFGEQNKKGKCIIKPGSSVTKILLLKEEDESPQFTLQVFDEQNKQAIACFDITLKN